MLREKRFYSFLAAAKIKWDLILSSILELLGENRRPIKVVLVHNEKRETFFPVFTTDLTMSAEQMIERYSARWKIECSIKELKHEIGALDNQARKNSKSLPTATEYFGVLSESGQSCPKFNSRTFFQAGSLNILPLKRQSSGNKLKQVSFS
jgi:hypothetical protein